MTFTMDTSGYVTVPHQFESGAVSSRDFYWSDLSPFAQGYVEKMMVEAWWRTHGKFGPHTGFPFYRLAPETLAAILRDCADETADETQAGYDAHSQGRSFWLSRQAGCVAPHLRPVTPYLGDDGKVRLRERS